MAFVGKLYAHEKDENFEAFVDSLRVPAEKLRKFRPKQKLEKNGDVFTLTAVSDAETKQVNFKLGEEFEETSIPGRPSKTVFTLDGNTLTEVQTYELDGNIITTKREYFDDKLIVTLTKNNWDGKAVRYYKAEL